MGKLWGIVHFVMIFSNMFFTHGASFSTSWDTALWSMRYDSNKYHAGTQNVDNAYWHCMVSPSQDPDEAARKSREKQGFYEAETKKTGSAKMLGFAIHMAQDYRFHRSEVWNGMSWSPFDGRFWKAIRHGLTSDWFGRYDDPWSGAWSDSEGVYWRNHLAN